MFFLFQAMICLLLGDLIMPFLGHVLEQLDRSRCWFVQRWEKSLGIIVLPWIMSQIIDKDLILVFVPCHVLDM